MDLKGGSKHRSIAQWAREAQRPCLLPSASTANGEKQRKGRTGREQLPLHPQSSTATRQLPGILFCSRTLEDKNPAWSPATWDTSADSLTGANGNQNQQRITRKPLWSLFLKRFSSQQNMPRSLGIVHLISNNFDLHTKATILSPRNYVYILQYQCVLLITLWWK